jgi:RHS repeat-associated protein
LYDGNDIVQESQGGVVFATYLRSLNIDELFGFLRQDGVYFYIHDGLGSTLALINQSGTPAVQYSYEPFGKTQSSNPTFQNPFQFTGRENDGTGLSYYRARYYSQQMQRFVSEDPIELLGGDPNFYAYAGNNPINFIDPLGLEKCPSFGPVFRASLNITNHFFFSFPTNLTRTAIGAFTSGGIARTVGTVSLFQALRSLPSGGIATLGGVGGTLGSAALNSLLNTAAVGVSLEVGIIAGSAINAGIQTLGCAAGLATFF